MRKGALLFLFAVICVLKSKSQSTFEDIHSILQTSCAVSGCHAGTSPAGNLDLSGSPQDVYNRIYDVPPTNPAAAARGLKLVDPGHPYRSFLLIKCGDELSAELKPAPGEGNPMPPSGNALAKDQIELIRQWIFRGAPRNGYVVNKQLIQDYYAIGGLKALTPPPPPPPGQGIQIHYGPLFFDEGEEREFLKREDLHITTDMAVTRMEVKMVWQSHHFLLFKFEPQDAANEPEGLRLVDGLTTNPFDGVKELTGAWQDDGEVILPRNTAFIWKAGTELDLDYHVINYSQDSILPAELFLNIYWEPNPGTYDEMQAILINNPLIFLPPNSGPVTFTDEFYVAGSTKQMNIWQIASHTHERGVDYDIFLRNPDGTKGTQIYEGFYDPQYLFNQGYYDWEHPPIRVFDTLLTVDMDKGLIHEATYINNENRLITFGLTSEDEMMLMTILYTETDKNGTAIDKPSGGFKVSVSPVPSHQEVFIRLQLEAAKDVEVGVYDITGKKITVLFKGNLQPGWHNLQMNPGDYGLTSGIYFLRVRAGERLITRKIVIQ